MPLPSRWVTRASTCHKRPVKTSGHGDVGAPADKRPCCHRRRIEDMEFGGASCQIDGGAEQLAIAFRSAVFARDEKEFFDEMLAGEIMAVVPAFRPVPDADGLGKGSS